MESRKTEINKRWMEGNKEATRSIFGVIQAYADEADKKALEAIEQNNLKDVYDYLFRSAIAYEIMANLIANSNTPVKK